MKKCRFFRWSNLATRIEIARPLLIAFTNTDIDERYVENGIPRSANDVDAVTESIWRTAGRRRPAASENHGRRRPTSSLTEIAHWRSLEVVVSNAPVRAARRVAPPRRRRCSPSHAPFITRLVVVDARTPTGSNETRSRRAALRLRLREVDDALPFFAARPSST